MIRQATYQDLDRIVHVHSVCFPDSYSTQLSRFKTIMGGGNLLINFYLEYLKDNPELFVVADDEKFGIVGFCMGYYMEKEDQMQRFLNKNRIRVMWKTLLLLLSCNIPTWKKTFSRFKHKPSVSD